MITQRILSAVLVAACASVGLPAAPARAQAPAHQLDDALRAVAQGKDPIPGPRTCFWVRGPGARIPTSTSPIRTPRPTTGRRYSRYRPARSLCSKDVSRIRATCPSSATTRGGADRVGGGLPHQAEGGVEQPIPSRRRSQRREPRLQPRSRRFAAAAEPARRHEHRWPAGSDARQARHPQVRKCAGTAGGSLSHLCRGQGNR